MASRKKTNSQPNIISESGSILQRCRGKLVELLDLTLNSFELEEEIDRVALQVGLSVWRKVEEGTATFSDLRDFVEEGNRRVKELEREIIADGSDTGKFAIWEVSEGEDEVGRQIWAKVDTPPLSDDPSECEKAEYSRIEDQNKQLAIAATEARLKVLHRFSGTHFFHLVVIPWLRKNHSDRISDQVEAFTFIRYALAEWPRDINTRGNKHALREWDNSDESERHFYLRNYVRVLIDAIDILVEYLNAVEAVPPQSPMPPGDTDETDSRETDSKREREEHPECSHGPDFRSINWYGRSAALTPHQSAVVGQLWEAMENGTPDVGWDTLKFDVGIKSERFRDTFGTFKEWGWLITQVKQGTYRLNRPSPD